MRRWCGLRRRQVGLVLGLMLLSGHRAGGGYGRGESERECGWDSRRAEDDDEEESQDFREVIEIANGDHKAPYGDPHDNNNVPDPVPVPTTPPLPPLPPADPNSQAVASFLKIVPDVDRAHLNSLVETDMCSYGAEQIVESAGGRGDGRRRKKTARIDFASADRPFTGGRDYGEMVVRALDDAFPEV